MNCNASPGGLYGGVPIVPSYAQLPTGTDRFPGLMAYTADTGRYWTFNGTAWVLTGGRFPYVVGNMGNAQVIPHATTTALVIDSADEVDTDAVHNPALNPSRFTIPATLGGLWTIGYAVYVSSIASTGNAQAWIGINGVSSAPRYGWSGAGAPTPYDVVAGATTDVVLAGGSYFEVFAFHANAGSLTRAFGGAVAASNRVYASYRGPA